MSNNALSSIRSALSTQLSAVTQLKDVESGKTNAFSGFPACRYYLSGISNQQEDTNNDYRTYSFTVDVIQPVVLEGVTVATLEADFQDTIDATMDKLSQVWTLAGNADNVLMQTSPIRVEEMNVGPCNVLTLNVDVKTLIPLT